MTNNLPDSHSDKVVSGPIARTVLSLALPVVAGMAMEILLSVVDFYWVGKLGASAQDAVTSSMVIIWTIFSAVSLISIGITALVSRHVGAGNPDRAVHYIRQAMYLAVFVAAAVTISGYFLTPGFMDFMKVGPATQAHAVPYLRIFFLSCVMLFLNETAFAIFRASGDTRTPTKVGILVVLLNLVLDPLLIFGYGPIPALGVPGASIATTISIAVGTVLIFRSMLRGKLGYRVKKLLQWEPDLSGMLHISRIGLPIASQQLAFVVVYWFLIGFVHEFGETAGAAMGIGNRMESFSYLTCYGFSLAASTMVGQNLGAGKPGRAARCAWGATGLGIGITLVFGFLFIAFPTAIASVFTEEPAVLEIAVGYLIILGLSQFAMAVEIILEGAFSGAGDTIPPMVVMLPGSIARIPLAWYLAFELDWGIEGIWWTLTITTGFKALVLAYWFSLGRWKTKKV
ncbi:MAG: MATE family efflux transporter [bacterium]|nr:MATE family efflux transporter [bacterium]